jgi:D-alanine-D-alanine ligase
MQINEKAKQNGKPVSLKEKKSGNPVKTLGPVPNLEEHVRPDWWRTIFNSFYLKTDGDVVDDINITRKEIDLFVEFLDLDPGDKILDLCCGQGRHSFELVRRGFQHVEALDRSHYLVQKAKGQSRNEGFFVPFREGDARRLPYSTDYFDVVLILGNSFGYFETIQDDLRVLKEVSRVMKPGGKLLIDVADGEFLKRNFQPRSWEWINRKYFVCRERSLSLDEQRLISREVIVQVNRGVIVDQFYAERLYTRESLEGLLKSAGFPTLRFHCNISPDSQRNQDLGMMEKRLIVTTTVEKKWSPVPAGKQRKKKKTIAVLFGDPSKKDILKPSSVFDEDDFYTIDQLKGALKELPDYTFSYIFNHDSLIDSLNRVKGKVDYVFNLCDEGLNNDPRMELHVPVILEALGFSYTGSGPRSLSYCYDKSLVRGIALEMGINVTKGLFIKPGDTSFELPFAFPVIVKPNFGDASFGITQHSVANDSEELVNAISEIREKFGYEKPVLVEEFLPGNDLSIGIIGNPPESYTVLPIVEEDYSSLPGDLPRLCGYEAKWMPESPYWNIKSIPAKLDDDVQKLVIEHSLKLFERLECRDYCRVDWRLDGSGNPHLLEVNPNPGWCWDGHLARMAALDGKSYKEMLADILKAAEYRFSQK